MPMRRFCSNPMSVGIAMPACSKQHGITVMPSPALMKATARASSAVRAEKNGRTPRRVKNRLTWGKASQLRRTIISALATCSASNAACPASG